MDFNMQTITISYAGTLAAYNDIKTPKSKSSFWSILKSFCGTYKNNNIDNTTRSAHSLITAIDYLNSNGRITSAQLQIQMWGNIDSRYKQIIIKKDINPFFKIEGFKTKKETFNKLKNADILFLPLESGKDKHKPLFIPGKLFEYFQIGKPILLLADKESDCAKIVQESNMGIICNPKDEKEIADTIFDIINKKINIANFQPNQKFINSFSFSKKTEELVKILNT